MNRISKIHNARDQTYPHVQLVVFCVAADVEAELTGMHAEDNACKNKLCVKNIESIPKIDDGCIILAPPSCDYSSSPPWTEL